MSDKLYGIRGATTVDVNEAAAIEVAVRELLSELTNANALTEDAVVSAIFSATPDLNALYPAAAARAWGWNEAPMLCVAEMPAVSSPARCIRLLLHASLPAGQKPKHVYLRDARVLRPDWAGPT